MKIARVIVLLAALLASAGAAKWIVYTRRSSELGDRIFGGSAALHAFRTASAVTAQRLHCNQLEGSYSLADYTREPPVPLSDDQTRQFKRVFTDRALYSPDFWGLAAGERQIVACGPPSYAVLFTTQSQPVVQVALCFRCDQFGVFVGESTNAPNVNESDPLAFMQPLLVTLVKSIYPSDPQLLAIKREDWLELSETEHEDLTNR